MPMYSEDEQELIHHTIFCFKTSLEYLIKNGYGIVISKEDIDEDKQYIICNFNGNLKILDLLENNIKDGTIMKVQDQTNNIH